jgi:hypothetical protein
MLNRFFILLIAIAFFGCGMAIHKENVVGNYYLIATDAGEDMNLGFKHSESSYWTMVRNTVYAVGFNKEFIIVKQHPREFPSQPDNTITNYFIVPIYSRVIHSMDKDVIGPLSKEAFEDKKIELGIDKDLPFSIVLEDLE